MACPAVGLFHVELAMADPVVVAAGEGDADVDLTLPATADACAPVAVGGAGAAAREVVALLGEACAGAAVATVGVARGGAARVDGLAGIREPRPRPNRETGVGFDGFAFPGEATLASAPFESLESGEKRMS